ncbi:MAG: hypothetical protein ACRCZU_13010, partial [Selenomonadaceae bacterium]
NEYLLHSLHENLPLSFPACLNLIILLIILFRYQKKKSCSFTEYFQENNTCLPVTGRLDFS